MDLLGLNTDCIAIHQVFKKSTDGSVPPPLKGTSLVHLSDDARDHFHQRVIDVMGINSKSVRMEISRADDRSAFRLARQLQACAADEFAEISGELADRLSVTHFTQNIPGGELIVFRGRAGSPVRTVIGAIKAEQHAGFQRSSGDRIEFLSDLFLTEATRLYKVGVFALDDSEFEVGQIGECEAYVFDSRISVSDPSKAADYFYSAFLGLAIPESDARHVRDFFVQTNRFIESTGIDLSSAVSLSTALQTYLRVDQAQTVSVHEFAHRYLPIEQRDVYQRHMSQNGVPLHSVNKDLSAVELQMRSQKVTVAPGMNFIAPAKAFQNGLIQIDEVPAEDGDADVQWTRILVRTSRAKAVG